MFGHKKLAAVGDRVSRVLRDLSPKYNNGRRVNASTSASATWFARRRPRRPRLDRADGFRQSCHGPHPGGGVRAGSSACATAATTTYRSTS